jgi:phosphate-induced protein 1
MRGTICITAFIVSACAIGSKSPTENTATNPGMQSGSKVIAPTNHTRPLSTSDPIQYNGGPVMTSTSNAVYFIWYGVWNSTAPGILTDWANNIGGSTYFNINTTYYDSTNTYVTNAINYGGSYTDDYSQGSSIDDNGVEAIVSNAISNNDLPLDPNGIYMVLAGSDVTETTGMCSQYCGWHYFGSIGGQTTTYAFIGNPDACPSACEAQTSSPNGDSGADGAASIMSHELEETVTDPQVSAWYDASGEENGDKCAWNFGTEQTAPNGSMFNVMIGSRNYLIQQNWNAATQACAQGL